MNGLMRLTYCEPHHCQEPCSACEIARLTAELEQCRKRIEHLEGEGYATASELLEDWYNQCNIQGTAEMTGEDFLSLMGQFAPQEQSDE